MSGLLGELPADTVTAIVIVGVVASLVAAGVTAWTTFDRRRHGPTIRRLARGLGLRRQDRRLLARVARAAGRTHPGALLISRGCFDHAARAFVHRHGEAARLRRIRRALFETAAARPAAAANRA